MLPNMFILLHFLGLITFLVSFSAGSNVSRSGNEVEVDKVSKEIKNIAMRYGCMQVAKNCVKNLKEADLKLCSIAFKQDLKCAYRACKTSITNADDLKRFRDLLMAISQGNQCGMTQSDITGGQRSSTYQSLWASLVTVAIVVALKDILV